MDGGPLEALGVPDAVDINLPRPRPKPGKRWSGQPSKHNPRFCELSYGQLWRSHLVDLSLLSFSLTCRCSRADQEPCQRAGLLA